MPLLWSSALASSSQRDRQRLLVAFVEPRSRLRETTADEFAGGEVERAAALERTEHDYVALVAAGAEAARLEAELAAADRRGDTAGGGPRNAGDRANGRARGRR